MQLRARHLCFLLPSLVWGAEPEQARPKKTTPFDPPSTVAAAQAPAETIEFAGISTIEQRTDLIFFDKTTKKHRWVPIGETVEGISALKYDPQREQATVKINGVQKTLALRKGSGPTNAPAGVAPMHTGFATPAPVPAPIAAGAVTPLPGPTPDPTMQAGTNAAQQPTAAATAAATPGAPQQPMTEQAKQEQEARMLVSDLLEIGMAQRKAYEEAQRKAQSGEQPAQPANPNATTTPPVQPQQSNTTPQPAPTRPPGGE